MLRGLLRPLLQLPLETAAGYTPVTGGGVLPETEALIARFTTPPTSQRKTAINAFFAAGKAGGWLAKADAIWFEAAADEQAARRNWIADAFNLSAVNAPAFTADRGFAGNGSTSYLDTGLNLTSGGLKATQNSHTVLSWANQETATSTAYIGSSDISIGPYDAGAKMSTRSANTSPNVSAAAQVGSIGLSGLSRDNGANYKQYKNGVQGETMTAASSPFVSQNLFLSGRNNGSGTLTVPTSGQHAFFFVGAALTDAEHMSLFLAVYRYMVSVGNAPALGEGSASALPLYHDFALSPDGLPPAFAQTGQAFGKFENNTGKLGVSSGKLLLVNGAVTGVDAAYLEAQLPATINRIGGKVSFSDVGGTRAGNNGMVAFPIWGDGGIVANGLGRRARLHATVSPAGLGIDYRIVEGAGQPLVSARSRTFSTPLAKDGTEYVVDFAFVGSTLWALGPDGRIEMITNANFNDNPTDKRWFDAEPYVPAAQTDCDPRVSKMWAA